MPSIPTMGSQALTNTQSNETDKRRKLTVERAKANHLSRQLQMRLQYAKLKVDYGWQKQSLNEVENLYFHHSHHRGSKPYAILSATTTPRKDIGQFASASTGNDAAQNTLFLQSGSSSLSRNSSTGTLAGEGDPEPTESSRPRGSTVNFTSTASSFPARSPTLTSSVAGSCPGTNTESVNQHSAASSGASASTLINSSHIELGRAASHPSIGSRSGRLDASGSQPSLSSVTWNLPPKSTTQNSGNMHRRSHSKAGSLSAREPPDFSSMSTSSTPLTYDSFWSSHSMTLASRRLGSTASLSNLTGTNVVAGSPTSDHVFDLARIQKADFTSNNRLEETTSVVGRSTAG